MGGCHGTDQSLLWEGSTPGHLNDGASEAQLIQAVAGPEARLRLCWRGGGSGGGAGCCCREVAVEGKSPCR